MPKTKTDKVLYMDAGAFPVSVGLALSPAAYDKEMVRLRVPGFNAALSEGANATTHVMDGSVDRRRLIIVCLNPEFAAKSRGTAIAATLVHEAVHVWDFIKEYVGVRQHDTEVNAYHIDLIAQFFMDCYAETLE